MVEQVFENEISSVLSPLAVPTPDRFPALGQPGAGRRRAAAGRPREAATSCIPFGPATHRFLTLYSEGGYAYLLLEDAVSMFLDRMFPHEEVLECVPFRLTRHADDERPPGPGRRLAEPPAEADDIAAPNDCVRLEIDERASPEFVRFILASSHGTVQSVFRIPGRSTWPRSPNCTTCLVSRN